MVTEHGQVTGSCTSCRARRNGVKHVSRGSILFTFLGDKVTDLLKMHGDLPGDDAFLS